MNKDKKLKYYTYELNMKLLNVLSILLFIIVGGIIFLMERNEQYIVHMNTVTFFIWMFLWLIIHELLHGIGFCLFKSVKKENITFGMFLERGIFYCMCKQKIKKKVILTSLLFPLTIIGIITLIIGISINHYELVFLSILNITSSIGDIIMTIYFLKAPKDIIYLDLDDSTSFTVLSKNDLTNILVPGIFLKTSGIYNDKTMYSKDKRKLVISKGSYILIIIIFILILTKIIGGVKT